MIGVLAGGVAGWGACLLLDSMDGCLDGCWPCQPPVSGQKGGQSPGLPALRVWMAGKLRGGGPPALQVHVSWSLGNCIQLPVRKLDTGREGAKILDYFLFHAVDAEEYGRTASPRLEFWRSGSQTGETAKQKVWNGLRNGSQRCQL